VSLTRKAAISLLVSVILLALFALAAWTGLFTLVETRFYDQFILKDLRKELAAESKIIDEYLRELQDTFQGILEDDAVRRSFLVNQNREDIVERSRVFAALSASLPGLQWVRFVDTGGTRIHFSTSPQDEVVSDTGSIVYMNYPEVSGYIPFDYELLSGVNMRRITFHQESERLVFYYPFYDLTEIYRGEALFSLSVRAISDKLLEMSRIKVSEDVSIISDPRGIVIGIPQADQVPVKEAIAAIWMTGDTALNIIEAVSLNRLVLLSSKISDSIFVGRVVEEKLFAFPNSLRVLLAASFFMSVFVILFLILNVRQDPVAIVQSRLKELQVSLMQEYYQFKGDIDWNLWRLELEQRREEVRQELKRGIKTKQGDDIDQYINSFFDKSWDDLLSAINGGAGLLTTFDEARLEQILSKVLKGGQIAAKEEGDTLEEDTGDDAPGDDGISELEPEEAQGLEELEADEESESGGISESEEQVEMEEVADAEELEELEEIQELEEVEELEEFKEAEGAVKTVDVLRDPDLQDLAVFSWEPSGISGRVGDYENGGDGAPAAPPLDDDSGADDSGEAAYSYTVSGEPDVPVAPAAESPASQTPAAERPASQVPDEEAPGSLASSAEMPASQAPDEAAWLKLAEETAQLEPAQIWADMAPEQQEPEVLEELTVEELTVEEAPAPSDDSLEKISMSALEGDPYAPPDASDEEYYAEYGDFIPGPGMGYAQNYVPDPLYDVEEFEEPDESEIQHTPVQDNGPARTFESPNKGINLNDIAKAIDASPSPNPVHEEDLEIDLDVSSPLNTILADNISKKEAPPKEEAPPQKSTRSAVPSGISSMAYHPFWAQNVGEPEYLESVDKHTEDGIIKERDGVNYIDANLLQKASDNEANVDPAMKKLVDSVLKNS
jgi:hypothetical protein